MPSWGDSEGIDVDVSALIGATRFCQGPGVSPGDRPPSHAVVPRAVREARRGAEREGSHGQKEKEPGRRRQKRRPKEKRRP